ncbi:unnamed protein product [Lota lota]
MASLCKRQQCTIERRGFRQELDSWRHKLIHCVGFESILEGLFGPRLIDDITLFQDCEPTDVSDWSFDENCLFCCSRREKKVKKPLVEDSVVDSQVNQSEEQSRICLERQAQYFLNAVLHRKELPGFSDPQIPLVAREIMQRMIRQFAAEYTSKTTQVDPPPPNTSIKDQSLLPRAPSLNPVLSKLLMADQDGPLDLTVRKNQEELEPSQQDGVLDLSTKKHHSILKTSPGLSTSPVVKGRSIRLDRASRDLDEEDGLLPRSLQDGRRDISVSSTSLKPPLARSLVIKEELRSQKHRLLSQPAALSLANLESVGLLNHGQPHALLSRESSGSPWGGKARLDNLLKLKQASGALCGALSDLKELPLFLENHHHNHHGSFSSKSSAHQHHHGHLQISKAYHHHNHDSKREQGHSPPVDLKIPQVRGVDLSWENHASDLYGYGPMGLGGSSLGENALSRKLRAILPKQNRRGGLGGLLEGASDYWSSSELDHLSSRPAYSNCDLEGDSVSKQPRKKRGRYRQYNSEILEEAIGVVMTGKMSVSKAQNIYGIPHSTLEYKVKERMGTLKNPPKKKLKLMMRMEGGPDSAAESENTPTTTPRDDGPPLAAAELTDD